MNYKDVLRIARTEITGMNGTIMNVLDVSKPANIEYAKKLAKVISKLSPLLGNMIEFSTVDILNSYDWGTDGTWIRQDPGFPDALFSSETVIPNPGIEIKAWFPFATEITARFKDSVTIFEHDQTDVALIAWLPEHVIWGKPQIIDTVLVSGKSVAEARDRHYHKPPQYIVFEPEDTHERSSNLQQTNTNGYKFQEDKSDLSKALEVVEAWGELGKQYSVSPEYQNQLKSLLGQFAYRLDTNFAKIDRIEHEGIESFKNRVLTTAFHGKTIKQWSDILSSNDEELLERELLPLIAEVE